MTSDCCWPVLRSTTAEGGTSKGEHEKRVRVAAPHRAASPAIASERRRKKHGGGSLECTCSARWIRNVSPLPFLSRADGEERRDAEGEHRPCRRLGDNGDKRWDVEDSADKVRTDATRRELLNRAVAAVGRIEIARAVNG